MVANGLGPWWFPAVWRRWLTRISKLFFQEAAWIKHDEGYARGDPSRAVCDWKFYLAMRSDSNRQRGFKRILCHVLSVFFYLMVRTFGWASYAGVSR